MVDDEILALEQLHYTRSVRESAEQLGAHQGTPLPEP